VGRPGHDVAGRVFGKLVAHVIDTGYGVISD
jgi:hypothetical protein